MLWALLLPDPSDPACPEEFVLFARNALQKIGVRPKSREELRNAFVKLAANVADPEGLRKGMMSEVVNSILRKAYPDERPLVVDSFAGGGSIPIEAARLGCEVFATDLNPEAVLILKAALEDIPRGGDTLIEEYRRLSNEVSKSAKKELSVLFPPDADGAFPVAYFWARTLDCQSCGALIPLVRSFWLSKPRKIAIRYRVVKGKIPSLTFEVFSPHKAEEVQGATVFQAKATCPCCHNVHSANSVRTQLSRTSGGIENCQLLAVATQNGSSGRRRYRAPLPTDEEPLAESAAIARKLATERLSDGTTVLPDETIPTTELRRIAAPLYGCYRWVDLFTLRQRVAVSVLCKHIRSATAQQQNWQVGVLMSLAAGKVIRHWNCNSRWHNGSETVAGAFGRQAIPMSWSFPEQTIWSEGAGSLEDAFESVARGALSVLGTTGKGTVQQADAAAIPLPSESAQVWFTDPPYYDAVAYVILAF
jgi:adenine-specific DNA methylase